MRAPYELEVLGPAKVEGNATIELTAVVDVAPPGLGQLDLELELPFGATLVSGSARERIVDARGVIERTFVIELAEIPQQDAFVIASLPRSDGRYGAYARIPYRFGRPAPKMSFERDTGRRRGARAIHLDPG
jgi:hypothetical protein